MKLKTGDKLKIIQQITWFDGYTLKEGDVITIDNADSNSMFVKIKNTDKQLLAEYKEYEKYYKLLRQEQLEFDF